MKDFLKQYSKYLMFAFLAFPVSSNYKLGDFGFGSGGAQVGSSNYSMMMQMGQAAVNNESIGPSYGLNAGLFFEHQANLPSLAAFDNPSNFYNKLHFAIDTAGNTSDTVYALAISKDDFATTLYVKNDNTVGTTLAITDYQTYTAWGGAAGEYVIGLESNTTYKMKVTAMKGKFSESGWGPVGTAATVNPQLTFDIDISATDQKTSPPYSIDFGDLMPATVVSTPQRIWVDLDTNGASGGNVYLYSKNTGLYSVTAGFTIGSISGNLDVATTGFGAQYVGVGQSSGGPLTVNSPYDGAGNVVGVTDGLVRGIFSSAAPVTSGRASFHLKAKSASDTPAASDYTETLTVIAAANY